MEEWSYSKKHSRGFGFRQGKIKNRKKILTAPVNPDKIRVPEVASKPFGFLLLIK